MPVFLPRQRYKEKNMGNTSLSILVRMPGGLLSWPLNRIRAKKVIAPGLAGKIWA
jgi:hypothetical protein